MSKLKPAIICGGALGVFLVLTAVITNVTSVSVIGCCNCLWPIGAGLLATMMFVKGSPTPAKVSDGAVVGLLTGVVGGLIYVLVALPIAYFFFSAALEAQMIQLRRQVPNFPFDSFVPFLIIGGIIGFVIFLVLALLGGLIAVPIFEKRKDQMPPPPQPQNWGGGQAA